MLEITPRLAYSPEGILELRKTADRDLEGIEAAYTKHKETIDTLPGYEVAEEDSDTVVRVEINKVIRTSKELNFKNTTAERLIHNLRFFTYFDYQDSRDGVFSLDFWANIGATGVIHPQFQRWLNANGLDEETGRRCIDAMAYPFGEEQRSRAKKEFSYYTDGQSAAAGVGGFTFGVISRRESFGIAEFNGSDETPEYRNGKVAWNWADLSTIGSCACWGVSGTDRETVYLRPDTNRLYEMNPHNVDFAVQSLSLVLGAATLAYEAAQYSGTEDILASVEWREQYR